MKFEEKIFDHDTNDDECKKHKCDLYAGCPKCAKELCLDKQKVIESIDKILETEIENGECYCSQLYEGECNNCKAKDLKKELGLEK